MLKIIAPGGYNGMPCGKLISLTVSEEQKLLELYPTWFEIHDVDVMTSVPVRSKDNTDMSEPFEANNPKGRYKSHKKTKSKPRK